MDWITQSKYIKWLIGILLAINLVTISIIWILIIDRKGPAPFEGDKRPQGTIEMMKKEINLSDDQLKLFEKLRKENFERAKLFFEKIDSAKKLLSEELADDKLDTVLINSLTNKIGILFAEMEKQRLKHFHDLLSICTKEQKEKLTLIFKNLIGGKPPQNMPMEGPMPQGGPGGQMKPPPPPNSDDGPKPFMQP
jgi:hypothetical protein